MRRPNFNLSVGMKDGSITKKDERHFEGLDNLFQWCTKHWESVCSENVSQPNVMTWRGILTKAGFIVFHWLSKPDFDWLKGLINENRDKNRSKDYDDTI